MSEYKTPDSIDVRYDSSEQTVVMDIAYRHDVPHASAFIKWKLVLTHDQAAELRSTLNAMPELSIFP
jgi:hypothetical protein